LVGKAVTHFRLNFPAFADDDAYPDRSIEFWFRVASRSFNWPRWGLFDPREHGRKSFMYAFAEEFGYSLAFHPNPAAETDDDDHHHHEGGAPILELGISMFVAHHLVLERQAEQRAALGGPPGVQVGALASVSGGPASVNYDTAVADLGSNAGHWALTTFGMRYLMLARMAGTGGVQI
jgi:hypothetical protein